LGLTYLDSCLLIYFVEKHPRWGRHIRDAIGEAGVERFAISPLVKCECLVGPLKRGDSMLEGDFHEAFGRFVTLDLHETVFEQAARLRARFGLRTPDALHLACAQHYRCDALWTNDGRLNAASHGLARNILA
jgi:uncharacterized protein